MDLPESIRSFLDKRQAGIVASCDSCNAGCCNGPGFAILENVIEIYKLYNTGKLKRSDFDFTEGLNLSQFVYKYFDRTVLNGKLLVFFPKMISDNNRLLNIPPWNFWDARDYIKKRERSLGCIFLEHKQYNSDLSENKCILHHTQEQNQLNEKPIDCLFLFCRTKRNIVKPSDTESSYWFALLDYSFPNSKDRFKQLCPDITE